MRASVFIPTHNEAQAIERVLADLPPGFATEVIVLEGDSNDGRAEIASRVAARVIQEPRRGYGRTCLTGLAAATFPNVIGLLGVAVDLIRLAAELRLSHMRAPGTAPRVKEWGLVAAQSRTGTGEL